MSAVPPSAGSAGLAPSAADEASLCRLLTTYAVAFDERDWPSLRSIFASGAQVDYSRSLGPTGPIEEILPWMEASMTWDVLPRCQHMLANLRVSVDGDEARGRADYLNADVFASPEGEHRLVVHSGVYRASFRREQSAWQITSLRAELYWRHEPPRNEVTFFSLEPDTGPTPGEE